MSQKVITIGNSLAVTIPKASAKKFGFRGGSRVNMHIDERREIISFRRADILSPADQKLAKLTADFMRRYDADLRELARK
jgi:antitoxin component of MazEF toxin-antitoxin module